MAHRRMARELTLQTLYSAEMTGDPTDQVLLNVSTWRRYTPEAMKYAAKLTSTVQTYRDECDRLIQETVEHWELSRIVLLDRIILQMGICELLFGENIPPRVAIDEAIELAKKYSTEKSGGFINGILDTILKRKKSQDAKEKKTSRSENNTK